MPTIAIVFLAAVAVLVAFRRQVVSHLTHWRGGPSHTDAYVPVDAPPALHLAVVGDGGHPGPRLDAIARAVTKLHGVAAYDALLLLGDNAYPDGAPERLQATVFGPFAALLGAGVDLRAIVGNHDVRHGNGPAHMAALHMPGPWWSELRSDVLLIGLDSNRVDDRAQAEWLDRTLAASVARWRIVAVHHPPYSAGYQGSSKRVREVFAPIFARHGVQLVLSGHDHDYQRSVPIDGVTYVVSGGGSRARLTGRRGFTAVSFRWHHFVDIAVGAEDLVLRAVDAEGRVGDSVTLAVR